MQNTQNQNELNLKSLLSRIELLEKRLGSIESILRIEWPKEAERSVAEEGFEEAVRKREDTESKVVEFGLAWLGGIVFLFGIVFLMTFAESLGYVVLSKAIAYAATILLFTISFFLRKSFPVLVNVLNICGLLLLYYITLKLHFFTSQPIIPGKGAAIVILFSVIGLHFYHAIRKNSEFLGFIAMTLCAVTAIVSDSAYITFTILAVSSIVALLLFYKKIWWKLIIYSLFIVYTAHLIWLFSNPVMGHSIGIVKSPQHNLLFILGYGIIFASSIFISKSKLKSNGPLVSITIWNALWFSFLLLWIIPAFYSDNYSWIFAAIAVFCLAVAVILKLFSSRNFAPATYACFGFMALSVAVYGRWGLPDAYFLLVLQSFLVVTMALWFRSKIIVVANALLLFTILLIYLITSESVDSVNFAFAFTSLATARILNWKKERLTLKTDVFRNIYLFVAFTMILYSLNKALPDNHVTFAWTLTAIGFFLLSVLLRNIKYRYLSIATIIVTAIHLFFVDLGQMDVGFRVIAFMGFAIISLVISVFYRKFKSKSK